MVTVNLAHFHMMVVAAQPLARPIGTRTYFIDKCTVRRERIEQDLRSMDVS